MLFLYNLKELAKVLYNLKIFKIKLKKFLLKNLNEDFKKLKIIVIQRLC